MALTTIKTTAIADDAVTADKLANSINSEIAANTAKVSLGSDSVTGAKIADDAINSEHYTDGSIDTAHIAADQITGALIADDAIGAEHIEVLDAALQFGDSVKSQFGAGNDLQIYHDGTNSWLLNTTGNLLLKDTTGVIYLQSTSIRFQDDTTNEDIAKFISDGACELYYDNAKKLDTHSQGVNFYGSICGDDGDEVRLGTGNDMILRHNGSNSFIENSTGNLILRPKTDEEGLILRADGAAELYYDNSKKFETTSDGVNVSGHLDLNSDTGRLKLGAGDDLSLYHDGSNSYIVNNSGSLRIWAKLNEYAIEATPDGAVDLYYDNSKKFETTNTGVSITNNAAFPDNGKAIFGAGDDFILYHDGSNSYITNATGEISIQAKAGENSVNCQPDNTTRLFYDGSPKLVTASGGVTVTGTCTATDFAGDGSNLTGITANHTGIDFNDNVKAKWGTGDDLEIYHDGSHSYLRDVGTGELRLASESNTRITKADSETCANFTPDGPVELYYDNSKKFETHSGGVSVFDHLDMEDNHIIRLGTSSDLQIYHNGTNSKIHNNTGRLDIETDSFRLYNHASSENMIDGEANGAVNLYYDNSKKLHTYASGINVTGRIAFTDASLTSVIDIPDSKQIVLGDSGDLSLYHTGSASVIRNTTGNLSIQTSSNLWLENEDGSEVYIKAIDDGAVELYYDNSKKFFTTGDGVQAISTGSYQLEVKRSGSATQQAGIKFIDGGDETARVISWSGKINLGVGVGGGAYEDALQCNTNGSVNLYYDNVQKLETRSDGLQVDGTVRLPSDSSKLLLGAGLDLEIFHDGSHSYIKDVGTGELRCSTNQFTVTDAAVNETLLYAVQAGAVGLKYDDSLKMVTNANGLKMYPGSSGDGIFEHDNTTSNNDRYLEIRNARSGSSRGRTAQMMIGENSSSEGDVIVRTGAGNADVSGGVRLSNAATSWSAMSDIRLKDKTGDITNALVDIAKIEPLKFTWKSDTNKTPQVGVSAQSVESVVPEAVSKSTDITLKEKGDNTEYLSVKYTELIPLCIAALQEAKIKIETLETKLSALESS